MMLVASLTVIDDTGSTWRGCWRCRSLWILKSSLVSVELPRLIHFASVFPAPVGLREIGAAARVHLRHFLVRRLDLRQRVMLVAVEGREEIPIAPGDVGDCMSLVNHPLLGLGPRRKFLVLRRSGNRPGAAPPRFRTTFLRPPRSPHEQTCFA